MELRQLEYALAVIDKGGFTRAAAAAHVSQPSLSQGVALLERSLGVRLFNRRGRAVTLTPAGELFATTARQVTRDLDTLRSAMAAIAGLDAGRLDLVALPTLVVDPVAHLIGAFRARYPRVTVRLREPEDADAVVDLVADGHCEIGFAELPVPSTVAVHELAAQEILAVFADAASMPRSRRLPVSRLATLPLVTTPKGTSTRRLLDAALAEAEVEPVVAVETSQREAILPLVLAGAGVAFLPRPAAEAARRTHGARAVPLDPPVRRRIGVIHRPSELSPAAAEFLALSLTSGVPEVANRYPMSSRRRSSSV